MSAVEPEDPGAELGNADEIAASVERRVSAWVDGRVRAAERRLELQSEAFEAALGEEAVGSRRATEQVEKVRRSLAAAADQALTEVSAAVADGRDELNAEVRERVDAELSQAEMRVRALGTAMQDEFRGTVAAANEERVDAAVRAAVEELRKSSDKARLELREDIANRLGEVGSEISAELDSRVERRLGEAVERVEGEGRRTLADASAAAAAAAATEVDARLPLLEGHIDRQVGGQRAAIEARFAAAEATLRSNLGVALDESAGEQDRKLREEAAASRKRINEELAAALQGTATELRRQLAAEREGARREFSQAARDEIAGAVQRLDQLHSAALSDAREAAEAVAVTRLSDVHAELSRRFESSRQEGRDGLERGLTGIDTRLREMFEEHRSENETKAGGRETDVRRRVESRIEELSGELSARVEREVSIKLTEALANLERANTEGVERGRAEVRADIAATIEREVAKGEARIAAATERVDLIAEERVAEGLNAVERRLVDQLGGRQLEGQQQLERRVEALGADLSVGLADESRESAARAAAEARRRALAGIAEQVDGSIAEATKAMREDLDTLAHESVQGAVSGQSAWIQTELETKTAAAMETHLQALREEVSRSSYRDHSRRAEAAATAQLARSLDALKQQRVALAAELARDAAADSGRVEGEVAAAVEGAKADLQRTSLQHRSESEAAVDLRAEQALVGEFERRGAELESRLDALVERHQAEASSRFASAASEAESRLAAVEQAQAREEEIRIRMNAAEREAEERVREAERRLIDVLARIDMVES